MATKWKWPLFATTSAIPMADTRTRWFLPLTAEEDVSRRDFTINGLLMRHATNEVLDYVGGRADLRGRHHSRDRRS